MGALTNSNSWEFFKGYALARTADDVRETKHIARAQEANSRQMVSQLDSLLSLQTEHAQISAYMTREIAQTNSQLGEMSHQLDELGFHIAEGLASVESAVREQTAMHRKHYEGVEREHILKEVIYNMKKFQDSMDKSTEPLSAAFGAKKLKDMLLSQGFGTRDLNSIQDKEYLDALLERCEKAWNSVSEKARTLLLDIEKLHFMANEMKEFNLADFSETKFPLKSHVPFESKEGSVAAPQKKEIPVPEVMKKYPKVMANLDDFEKEMKKRANVSRAVWLGIPAALTFFVIMGIIGSSLSTPVTRDGKQVFKPSSSNVNLHWQPDDASAVAKPSYSASDLIVIQEGQKEDWTLVQGSDGRGWVRRKYIREVVERSWVEGVALFGIIFTIFVVGPIGFIVWLIVMVSGGGIKRFGISPNRLILKQLTAAQSSYAAAEAEEQQKYNRQLAEYERRLEEVRKADLSAYEETKRANESVDQENLRMQEERRKLEERHQAILNEFTDTVNAFLDQHRGVQQFIRRIAA